MKTVGKIVEIEYKLCGYHGNFPESYVKALRDIQNKNPDKYIEVAHIIPPNGGTGNAMVIFNIREYMEDSVVKRVSVGNRSNRFRKLRDQK